MSLILLSPPGDLRREIERERDIYIYINNEWHVITNANGIIHEYTDL
jgi:hypothetical protein